MAATPLTYDQFREQYGSDCPYEFWYGEAAPKGMPTWVHGLLQQIVMGLLREHGFIAGSGVELQIDPAARPKPDVLATKTKLAPGPHPTEAMDVVIEILSEDDAYVKVQEKCRSYQAWGFRHICLVVSNDRSVLEWRDGASVPGKRVCRHFVPSNLESARRTISRVAVLFDKGSGLFTV